MPSNTTVVPISLPKEMAKELDRNAKRQEMTRSEYERDMLRKQVSFAKMDAFRDEFSRRAKKAGIRTQQDAVRAGREIRDGK